MARTKLKLWSIIKAKEQNPMHQNRTNCGKAESLIVEPKEYKLLTKVENSLF